MNNLRIFAISFIVLLSVAMSNSALAHSVKWCGFFRSEFVDRGNEDVHAAYYNARYARFKLLKKTSSGSYTQLHSGYLGSDGCTPYYPIETNTNYKFKVGSKLKQTGGRAIYVQPDNTHSKSNSWQYVNYYYNTTYFYGAPPTWKQNFFASFRTHQTSAAAVARQLIANYNKLEYPANQKTHVIFNCNFGLGADNTFASPSHDAVCISTNHEYHGLDHSRYKFCIAHEFGHLMSSYNGGPLNTSYGIKWQTNSPDPCNCERHSTYKTGCLQSRGVTGKCQSEAWAWFYGAMMFNYRGSANSHSDCDMTYWRAAYQTDYYGSTTDWPPWDNSSVVDWKCDANPRWMERYCLSGNGYGSSDYSTTIDWTNFFWNVWSNGSQRYTVDQLTDIWDNTPVANNHIGERYSDLVSTVNSMFPNYWKRYQFTHKAVAAGVNH